jgi:hypothetical protein
LLVYRKATDFCKLIFLSCYFFWSCLWCLGDFGCSFSVLCSVRSCHLPIGIICLLLYLFMFLLFFLLALLLWLGFLRLCWIVVVRVDTLISFLTLQELV